MCGRYALGIRASFVRYQLQRQGMPVDDAVEDNVSRETYNFPPGAIGLVYRAEVPDSGLRENQLTEHDQIQGSTYDEEENVEASEDIESSANDHRASDARGPNSQKSQRYELKAMKWGLIPSWTKRSPDYSSVMRTINCRDDSLLDNRGMWTNMKQKKRCIVIAQGFYEWLKKGPKEKVPHFVKRKDGQLMCFAGLWDAVKYEDASEKLYSYTIITTDSNKQLQFLHDRMPVIFDPNTDALSTWLDPTITQWSDQLQSILKPYQGELECYPVNKEVGKVGNNSPDFILPVDSKENKKNIANFFDNAQKKSPARARQGNTVSKDGDRRPTKDQDDCEHSAPMPIPEIVEGQTKRSADFEDENENKKLKVDDSPGEAAIEIRSKTTEHTPAKKLAASKTRSATSNKLSGSSPKSAKHMSKTQPSITNFFDRH